MTRGSGLHQGKTTEIVLAVMLVITGICILAAGCTSPATAPAVATPPAPATDAGIRIITEDLPPLNYAGPDGKATGLATEVANGILARLGQRAEIEVLPWSEGYAAALAGPNVAFYSTARTDEREQLFKWVGPVAKTDYTFYVKSESGISLTGTDEAKTAGTICVVKDNARHQFLVQNFFTNIVTGDTDASCLRNLSAGKADLWLGSSLNAPSIAKREGIDPASFKKIYTVRTVPVYLAFSRDTPDRVITAWQQALDSMKADGSYATIQQKYGMDPAAAPATGAGIRIITEELPPFNYAAPDGTVTGQSTEVVNTILVRLGQKAAIEILPWSEGYAAVQKGPMVALFSTGRTEEREHLFKWAGPITAYDFTFYTRNGSAITVTSVEAAKTAGRIGVVKDDARHQFLTRENFTNIVTCDTDAECIKDLLADRTDLWFGSAVNFPATVKKESIDPLRLRQVLQVKTVPMYIAFSPDTPDRVVMAWQEAIDAMKNDGSFTAIRQKYGLSPGV